MSNSIMIVLVSEGWDQSGLVVISSLQSQEQSEELVIGGHIVKLKQDHIEILGSIHWHLPDNVILKSQNPKNICITRFTMSTDNYKELMVVYWNLFCT